MTWGALWRRLRGSPAPAANAVRAAEPAPPASGPETSPELPRLHLLRTDTGDHGTFGVLTACGPGGPYACQSAEPPWRDNRRNLSAIPPGRYRCVWHRSPRYGWVYWVQEVPGRDGILLHAGNLAGDREQGLKTHTEGCLLPGAYRGLLEGQRAVLASRVALGRLVEALGGAAAPEIRLTVEEGYR
ncbi:MAG: DUF5675 family protein [Thermodesulfobacteriota bacterium]